MRTHDQSEQILAAKRRGRGCLVWLGGLTAFLVGLMLLGAGYEALAEAADGRAYPPPGQMVDVGGYRLHINCVGTGSPTVVIEAGMGDWSASWSSRVQPEAAKTTRVCTYDRAGLGWSEPGPLPRTAEQFAHELHSLLHNAQVPGPYVLVGHSLGGFSARVFAHAYAAEVAGVVLIESMHPHQAKPAATPTQPRAAASGGGSWIVTLPARIGVLRLLAGPLDLKGGLAPEVANAYVAYAVRPRSIQTMLDEGQGLPASLAQAAAIASLDTVPLIVLSAAYQDGAWQAMQADLLQLSSSSQQLIAEGSGHNVQLDQPAAAVGAIVQLVEQIRRQAGQ